MKNTSDQIFEFLFFFLNKEISLITNHHYNYPHQLEGKPRRDPKKYVHNHSNEDTPQQNLFQLKKLALPTSEKLEGFQARRNAEDGFVNSFNSERSSSPSRTLTTVNVPDI